MKKLKITKRMKKFLDQIIAEPTGVTHEVAMRRKVNKSKMRKYNLYLWMNGVPKTSRLEFYRCETCMEHTGWRVAYHLELVEG